MKYKVGDKVRVRKDLEIGKTYDDLTFNRAMETFKGRTLTIKSLDITFYKLEEDEFKFSWSESMLEAVKATKYITIKEKTLKKYQDKAKKNFELFVETALKNENLKGQIETYEKVLGVKQENDLKVDTQD